MQPRVCRLPSILPDFLLFFLCTSGPSTTNVSETQFYESTTGEQEPVVAVWVSFVLFVYYLFWNPQGNRRQEYCIVFGVCILGVGVGGAGGSSGGAVVRENRHEFLGCLLFISLGVGGARKQGDLRVCHLGVAQRQKPNSGSDGSTVSEVSDRGTGGSGVWSRGAG